MKRYLKWALAIILGSVFVLFLLVYFIDLGPVDHCVDMGGCWDSVSQVCRKDEPNANELCRRAKNAGKADARK